MAKPVLWQIKVSHFSEKIRWALEYKGVEHERRSPPPGPHMAFALAKSRGASKTFPLLDLDGRTLLDSTDIVAALEERWPEPPLYPADPADRARALELEDFFDEEVGPYTRLYAWHEIIKDRPTRPRSSSPSQMPGPLQRRGAPCRPGRRRLPPAPLRRQVPGGRRARPAPRSTPASTGSRPSSAIGDYLVGDSFTVADLTAAALFYPSVLPPKARRSRTLGRYTEFRPSSRSPRLQVRRGDVRAAPQAREAPSPA